MKKTIIQLKEEQTLLSRFLITARKRPEKDLEESIGNNEFSVMPKSMFTDDGQLLLSTDKAKILHQIESLVKEESSVDVEYMDQDRKRVTVVDGMALVNRVHKNPGMKTWKEFAEGFVALMMTVSQGFDEIRLIFDRYIIQSLKSRARKKRTSGNKVRYKVSHDGNIDNVRLKQLLTHIETKRDLTIYLPVYSQQVLQKDGLKYSITYDMITVTNIPDFSMELTKHDHEEADT